MAQPIHCDAAGCDELGDVLVSRLTDGESTAWCFTHYVTLCQAIVADTDAQAAEAARLAQAEAERSGAADSAEGDEVAAEVASRLDGERSPEAEALGVAVVVPRGRSRSRRAHEGRQRARAQEVAIDTAPDVSGPPGPPDAELEAVTVSQAEA